MGGTLTATGQIVPKQPTEIQPIEDGAAMFERWAKDPSINVEKFERFMVMWERERARRSEAAFDAAMNEAQHEMEPVRKDATNPQTKSRYASYEALDSAVRPIYTRAGFALSFDTGDAPSNDEVRMLCYVTRGGHKRTYKLDMPADGKGAKGGDVMTRTHATGSAVTYGRRYLLTMIFNIATTDDDGNKASQRPRPPQATLAAPAPAAPQGADWSIDYKLWFDGLASLAAQGAAAFTRGWEASPEHYKKHLQSTDAKALATLRTKARKAGE